MTNVLMATVGVILLFWWISKSRSKKSKPRTQSKINYSRITRTVLKGNSVEVHGVVYTQDYESDILKITFNKQDGTVHVEERDRVY